MNVEYSEMDFMTQVAMRVTGEQCRKNGVVVVVVLGEKSPANYYLSPCQQCQCNVLLTVSVRTKLNISRCAI